MAALQVKDAFGINEKLMQVLAQQDPTWEKIWELWQRVKFTRFDSLTPDQVQSLETVELDLQEIEMNAVYSLF